VIETRIDRIRLGAHPVLRQMIGPERIDFLENPIGLDHPEKASQRAGRLQDKRRIQNHQWL
jgi:hypothetical protein